ncbi:hypothetical protein B0H17DRAFT_1088997 [Mycena rosella]|uniref:Uncharacterized protein n=1 Tax=Mycena rosella TaxID=1033263 RepID=A0AAD7CXK5_MYCRO|nr:hypothetical protein B0H17DRAFT_1088997 [Mycena rosella]
MDNVLSQHPELAPDVFKTLSDALTSAKQNIRHLERRLKEKADAESSRAAQTTIGSAATHTDVEFAALQASYERERDSGREIRATLEDRYIELRTREAAVEEGRRIMDDKMEGYRQRTEALVLEATDKASALQAQLAASIVETKALQHAFDSSKLDASAREDAWAALSAVQEENLRASQKQAAAADAARSHELDQRRKLQSALKETRVSLASKTAEFKAHSDANEGALRTLRTKLDAADAHTATVHAAHARLENEVRDSRARQAAGEHGIRDLNAIRVRLENALNAKDAELVALQNENTRMNAASVAAQGQMQIHANTMQAALARLESEVRVLCTGKAEAEQLAVLREKAVTLEEDNCALLEARHTHDRERAALTETVTAMEGELEELRAEHDASVVELEELRLTASALKDTLKNRMIQISEYKTRIIARDQNAVKVKHEVHARLQHDHEMQDEATNKNLRASVLNAGVQAKQELQKAAEDERKRLDDTLWENDRLRKERNSLLVRLEAAAPIIDRIEGSSPFGSSEQYSGEEDDEDQEPDDADPRQERQLYRTFMNALSSAVDRPFKLGAEPVQTVGTNPLEIFRHDFPTSRRSLHCPKRTVWCGGNRAHALMLPLLGQKVDFFVNQGTSVYYVGTYMVHSLRSVHPPGSKIASDVVRSDPACGGPEPAPGIRTECFGLQCVGFDHLLYDELCLRFKNGCASQKRKAAEDLRSDVQTKRRVS